MPPGSVLKALFSDKTQTEKMNMKSLRPNVFIRFVLIMRDLLPLERRFFGWKLLGTTRWGECDVKRS
jgi:hypothetical protein